MMLRDTEADFFANFKSAIVSTKQKLRRLVRILVGQNDAAVVPDVYGLKLRGVVLLCRKDGGAVVSIFGV